MRELYGHCHEDLVLIHGGAGGQDPKSPDAMVKASLALQRIAHDGCMLLNGGSSPLEVVANCLEALEANELFNAGKGSALQSDGQARLTAAMMNGSLGTFSGVIGAMHILHPSRLARYLQTQKSRVLASPGAELLARQLCLPVESPLSNDRIEKWQKRFLAEGSSCDTVGVLVRTTDGELFAGTSTGGRGFEFPGRVSDSATVAGTYASSVAAISATGVGEEIVDDALAARLETRRRDGLTLKQSSQKCFSEASVRKRMYGWIAVDKDGFWGVAHTTPVMSYAVYGAASGLVATSGSQVTA